MLGTIHIYHSTDDKRIIDYLNRNIRTHQLAVSAGRVNMTQQVKYPKGNGNIRATVLMMAFVMVLILIGAAVTP